MPRKIGLMTCRNATQDLSCCSISCLRDFSKKAGCFERYDNETELSGIISCAGCPTLAYPEKILHRVEALTRFGIRDIHFSNCMVALCPYVEKYIGIINRHYPEVSIIQGSHAWHITPADFRSGVRRLFECGGTMGDFIQGKFPK